MFEGILSFWKAGGITYSLLAQAEMLSKNILYFLYFQAFLGPNLAPPVCVAMVQQVASQSCQWSNSSNPPVLSRAPLILSSVPVTLHHTGLGLKIQFHVQKCPGKRRVIASIITVADESDPRPKAHCHTSAVDTALHTAQGSAIQQALNAESTLPKEFWSKEDEIQKMC